jgi:TolB-like protein/DNA-binding winged helix-turn-helix (wHTH) protein
MSREIGREGARNTSDSLSAAREQGNPDASKLYEFGPFRLDAKERKLLRGNEIVALTPKAFDMLHLLVQNSGHLLEKDELMRLLWPDSFVEEGNLASNISHLRKALGENPQYIETVPKRGYRFVGAVRQLPNVEVPRSTGGSVLQPTSPIHVRQPAAATRASIRRMRLAFVAIFVMVLAIAAIGWKVSHDRRMALQSATQIRSLAVLPLANLSRDPEQDYFSDGLTEALTNDLGKFSALRVISRTSAIQYKGTKKTVPEIAGELNVDAVIEGTVLRSGNHVRITVNLIQARPERHLWAENYETEAGDVLTLQATVAQSVAREIQIKLTPPEKSVLSGHTVDPAAQDLYFRGLYALYSATAESAQNAIDYFQRAIQKDALYAPAYAGLAVVYAVWLPGESGPRENIPKAREAALKALALDETLPWGHAIMGYIELCYDWNWVDAEKEFKRALELNANDSHTQAHYARELVILGRTDEALVHVRQAMSLDPYSPGDAPSGSPTWPTVTMRHCS